MDEIKRAELFQAINAYLIPSGLFVSCLFGAAGLFLIKEGYGLGWALMVCSAAIIFWAFFAFITFQNKLRAKGKIDNRLDTLSEDFSDNVSGAEQPYL